MNMKDIQIQNLYEALKAADYLIDRLDACHKGKKVRDLDEAFEWYRRKGPALIAAYEKEIG